MLSLVSLSKGWLIGGLVCESVFSANLKPLTINFYYSLDALIILKLTLFSKFLIEIFIILFSLEI